MTKSVRAGCAAAYCKGQCGRDHNKGQIISPAKRARRARESARRESQRRNRP
jgi:hypothetical protein